MDPENFNFSEALNRLRNGEKVARKGWNGKDMFLFLVPGSKFKVNRAPLLGIYPEGTEIDYCGHIDMKLADGRIMVWTPAQIDLLGDDWQTYAASAPADTNVGETVGDTKQAA